MVLTLSKAELYHNMFFDGEVSNRVQMKSLTIDNKGESGVY